MKFIGKFLPVALALAVAVVVSGCSSGNSAAQGSSSSSNSNMASAVSAGEMGNLGGPAMITQIDGDEYIVDCSSVTTKKDGTMVTARKGTSAKFKVTESTKIVTLTSHKQGTKVDGEQPGSKTDLTVGADVYVWGSEKDGTWVAQKVQVNIFK